MKGPPVAAIGVVLASVVAPAPLGATAARTSPAAAVTGRLSGYRSDAWRTDQGLPQDTVFAVAQTADGYLWMGTEEGLARFDGQRFAVFDGSTVPQLRGHVHALLAARDGSLWLGTLGGGALRYADGAFRAYTQQEGLPGNDVMAVAEDRDGAIWLGTTKGLVRLGPGGMRTFTVSDGLPDEHVWAIARGRRGLWIATRKGVALVNHEGVVLDGSPTDLAGQGVRAVLEDSAGALWMATEGGGLYRRQDAAVRAFTIRDGLPSDVVFALLEDRGGAVWIGTNGGGIARFESGAFRALTTADGLSSDLVLALFEDREGNLWAGTNAGGVDRLRPRLVTTYSTAQGLSHDVVLAVLEDRDGALWTGTAGGGLNRLQDGRVQQYTTRDGLPSDLVLSLAEDVRGGLWVGTNRGLARLEGGRARTYGSRDGLPREAIVALCAARDGTLWLGTHGGGLVQLKDGTFRIYTRADGLPDDRVWWISEAASNGLWIGTSDGLARWVAGSFTPAALPARQAIFAVHEDADGTVWIGTRGGGLIRMQGDAAVAITSRHGMFDDSIFRILDDGQGRLWVSSNKGIARVRKQDLHDVADGRRRSIHSVVYGTADGMKSAECNGGVSPAGWRTRDGRLWFPTIRGLAVIDPTLIGSVDEPLPVVIEQVIADGESVDVHGGARLAPGTRRLEFHYTAPTTTAPDKATFRFRLDGFDREWVDAGTRRRAEYTGLRPGAYRFRVTAANRDGVWNETGASFAFEVAPRFHQTWLFYVLCILAALAVAEVVHRWRAAKADGQRLEGLVATRTAALTEATLALARNEARFRALVENSSDVVVVVDREGRVRHASAAVDEVLGQTPASLLGAALLDFIHVEDAAAVAAAFKTGSEDVDPAAPLRFRARHHDGTWRLLEAVSTNMLEDPAVGGTVLNARDVTERERLELQLRQAQKMEAVGRLAGGIAHDFNNLLSVILGYSDILLRRTVPGDPSRRKLEEMKRAAERAASLTRQLLAFSRRHGLEPEILQLGSVVGGFATMLRRLLPEDVVLITSVPPEAGRIRADRLHIEQVIMNLVVNARDAMPEGGKIVIEVEDFDADEESVTGGLQIPAGAYVQLAVTDQGVGMDEETRRHIFDPFFTTKGADKGTGLGLWTVLSLVRQNEGHIRVDSTPGHGTRLSVYFPRRAAASEIAAPPAETAARLPRGWETVLLVEDELCVRAITREILESLGYRVIEAADGDEALRVRQAHKNPVHLLLTDVVMPVMGGRECATRLAATDPALRVMYMSGYLEDVIARRGVSGEADLVQKPFTAEVLAVKMREVLDRGQPLSRDRTISTVAPPDAGPRL